MLESFTQLFALLGHDPNDLIGQPETSWLDFKDQPYLLEKTFPGRDRQRFELAKDISALANAKGGVVLLGVKTEIEEELQEEVAKELRPIAPGMVNPTQIQAVIWEWIQPKLNIEVQSHSVPGEGGELWSIFVLPQQERDLPFIVAGEFIGEGRGRNRNLFGVYERVGSQNSPYPTWQVQRWIHDGRYASPEKEEAAPVIPDTELADLTLADDLSAIGGEQAMCYYYIQAIPQGAGLLARFYRGAPDPLHDALSVIPYLRQGGFHLPSGRDGLETGRTAGQGLRVVWPTNDSLSVTPGGLTTAIEGQEHLTWASQKVAPEGELWINPLAVVEFALEFWRFYVGQIQSRKEESAGTLWRAGMRSLGGSLPVYLPGSFVRRSERQRSDTDDFDLEWVSTDERDPGRLAFDLLSRVYGRFAFAEEVISWADDRRISEQAILDIKRGGAI